MCCYWGGRGERRRARGERRVGVAKGEGRGSLTDLNEPRCGTGSLDIITRWGPSVLPQPVHKGEGFRQKFMGDC